MQSSRDSSVWRSLAVAFGDGLAFGVGMTLTQPGSRVTVAAPQPEAAPLSLRLDQIEQRIAEVEQRPRALATLEKGALQGHPFDQKVLEAVVKALDARLHEHAGLVERELTELQAKITIELKTLHQQDRSIADGLQEHIEGVQREFTAQIAALRQAADAERSALQDLSISLRRDVAGLIAESLQSRAAELQEQFAGQLDGMRTAADADRRATQQQLAALRHEVAALAAENSQLRVQLQQHLSAELETVRKEAEADRTTLRERIGAMHHDVADMLTTQMQGLQQEFREELRESVNTAASNATSAANAAMEEHARELEAVRQSAEAGRTALREQIASLRQDFRQELREAVSMATSNATSAANAAMEEHAISLRAAVEAKDREIAELRVRIAGSDQATLDLLQGVGEICRRAAERIVVPEAPPPPAPPAVSEEPEAAPPTGDIPGFAQSQPPGKLWRVPLVSSLVLTTGAMFMLHYL